MAKRSKPTSDAVEILHRRFYAGRPSRLKKLEEARSNEEIARNIHGLRTEVVRTPRVFATTAIVRSRKAAGLAKAAKPCATNL
jgi:hypothetical protein